jgi:hypothetical protein
MTGALPAIQVWLRRGPVPVDVDLMRWLSLLVVLTGCRGMEAAVVEQCPALPYFTQLPVDEGAVLWTTVIGPFSPPGHTLPSDHGGVYVQGQGIPLRAPGPLTLTSIRRTRYLASTFRTGGEDFALDLNVCDDVRVTLGHIVSLPEALAALVQPGGCQQYSTANETVESCHTRVKRAITAGEPLGTVGGATALAFDFGVYDRRHHNTFANPTRYGEQMIQAVCPWELFADEPRRLLLSRVGLGTQRRMGEPACGTMEVDRPGTPQGMWIEESRAGGSMSGGDESPYITLTNDVVRPAEKLFFSIGVPALGPGGYQASMLAEGPRQRPFAQVPPDGSVICYEVQSGVFRPEGSPRMSFLLSLTGDRLRLEKREDAVACDGEPATWAFGPAARTFVR